MLLLLLLESVQGAARSGAVNSILACPPTCCALWARSDVWSMVSKPSSMKCADRWLLSKNSRHVIACRRFPVCALKRCWSLFRYDCVVTSSPRWRIVANPIAGLIPDIPAMSRTKVVVFDNLPGKLHASWLADPADDNAFDSATRGPCSDSRQAAPAAGPAQTRYLLE